MTLREKLHQIYSTIDAVEKRGHNTSQKYDYIKAADVTNAIRKQLIELRVYAEINFEFVGGPYTIARKAEVNAPFSAVNVRCNILFHDLDSLELLTSSGLGTGADTGDKAAYKAQTGALKYALKNSALVPDEADPEADESVDEGSNNRQTVQEEPPDFQEARHAAPRLAAAPKTQKVEERPTAAPVAKSEAPQSEPLLTEASSTTSAASTQTANSAATPQTTSAAQDAGREPGDDGGVYVLLPTEEELTSYRQQFSKLGDDLSTGGKLKSSKGLMINRKLLVFLLSVAKVDDAKNITKAQWDDFFARVEKAKALESGLVGLAQLVNKANGIEETKK